MPHIAAMNSVCKPIEVLMQKLYDNSLLISSLEKQMFYKLQILFLSHIQQTSVKYMNIYVCACDIFLLFC